MKRVIFNPQNLMEWKQIAPDTWQTMVQEILTVFFQASPVQYNEILRAFQHGDMGGVRRAAHKMKSTFANVGGEKVYELLNEIEFLEELNRLDALMSELDTMYDETVDEIKRFNVRSQAA